MSITETIDTQVSELARAFEANSQMVAELTPPPLNVFVRRIGAINAEAIRQSGRLSMTAVDAAAGLAGVAWRGAGDLASTTERAFGASAETVRSTSRRALGDVRQASSTIGNRARSAAGQVSGNLQVVGDRADEVGDDVARQGRTSAGKAVKATDTATAQTAAAGANRPTGAYENWTKDELYERAQELDIDGRSGMSKNQLVEALRSA